MDYYCVSAQSNIFSEFPVNILLNAHCKVSALPGCHSLIVCAQSLIPVYCKMMEFQITMSATDS